MQIYSFFNNTDFRRRSIIESSIFYAHKARTDATCKAKNAHTDKYNAFCDIFVTVNYSLQFFGETFGGDTKRGL